MIKESVAIAIMTIAGAAAPALGAVAVSTAPTQDMACSAGVCTPTATTATLNVRDLENMLASGSIEVATSGVGQYNKIEAGKIVIKAAFAWSTPSTLSLNARSEIEFTQPVSVAGPGGVLLYSKRYSPPVFEGRGSLGFASLSSVLSINESNYTLVNSIAALASVLDANNGAYCALAVDYDASQDGTYDASPITTWFVGRLDGLGHTISNLSVKQKADDANYVGFVAESDGTIEDLHLTRVSFRTNGDKSYGGEMGGLVGYNDGVVLRDSVTGTIKAEWLATGGLAGYNEENGEIAYSSANVRVTSGDAPPVHRNDGAVRDPAVRHAPMQPGYAGGLVAINVGLVEASHANGNVRTALYGGGIAADNEGEIVQSYATGTVTGGDQSRVGGLVGKNGSEGIGASYATGAVSGGADSEVGGLLGESDYPGRVETSYSTGTVSGGDGSSVGGFAGAGSGFTDCYWDTDTSGTDDGIGGGNADGITGLTTEQFQAGLPAGFEQPWAEKANINNGLPYLTDNPPPK